MKQFQYKAIDNNNQRSQGYVEAKDTVSAAKILRDRGLIITHLTDPRQGILYSINSKLSRVSGSDVISFTKQLASMINAGLPITKSIELIKKQTKPAMEKVVQSIQSAVEGGQSLHDALAVYNSIFNPLYLSLVKAGEVAGILGTVMEQLSVNLQRSQDFKAKVKSAMMYPAIVIVAMFVVGIVMIFFVMPQMESLFSEFDAQLPLTTQLMINSSAFIRNQWYLLLPMIVLFSAWLMHFFKSPKGKLFIDKHVLKLPIIGPLQNKVIATNIIRTLSLLNGSGVSIVESLDIVSKASGNQIYEKAIMEAAKKVEKGISLGASFGVLELFPEMIIQMIIVGEETGKLAEMMEKAAKQLEKESILALKTLTGTIEPLLIVILGIAVGFMVISIITPIYSLTQNF